jgi:hypothetical protein
MSNSPIPPIGFTPPSSGSAPGQVVQIVSLPDALQNSSRALRMDGEVVQHNRDGSIRIKTPEGNVDVNVRGRQPQPGQKVEMEVAAGNPPKTATIRNAPQAPAQPPPTNSQAPSTPPPPATNVQVPQTPVAARPPATATTTTPTATTPTTAPAPAPVDSTGKPLPPLPTSYPAPTKPIAATTNPAQLPQLTNGQIVRLTPVLPSQLPTLQQSVMPSIAPEGSLINSQLGTVNFQAGLIARGAQDGLLKNLIQIIKPGAAPLPNLQPPGTSSSSAPQVTQAPQQPLTAQQTIAKILGSIFSNTPAVPNIRIASTMPLMPSLAGSASLENTLTQSMPSLRPLMFDARILDIKLPQVKIMSTPSNTQPGSFINATSHQNSGNHLSSTIKIPMDVLSGGAKPAGIIATVTGFTPQNLPLISIQWPNSTAPQNYILQFASSNLQTGSQLVLQPQSLTPALGQTTNTLRPVLPLLQASMLWPAMDETFQTLMQTSPQLAQTLGKIIPSPANPSQMGPAAMLFIAAARAGDLQNWLGEKRIDALQKISRQSLMSRLSGELTTLASSADSQTTEWRSYPLPLLWQSEISKVMLHMHHDRGANEQNEGESGTHFIMDLQLTRMGDVQLDGLLKEKRLDLIIRTQVPISQSMQEQMRKAYADALNGTDIYGELAFQGDLKNWMQVVKREEMYQANA